MARLSGVYETGNVIEYNGVRYESTEDDPQVGDILRSGTHYSFMPKGAFYAVVADSESDNIGILDEDETFLLADGDDIVFRRNVLTTAQIIEQKRAAVASLNAEIAELETEMAEESALKVGDYARFVSGGDFSEGTIVVVDNTDGQRRYPYEVHAALCPELSEYVSANQLERLTPAEARAALIAQIDALFPVSP